MKFTEEQYQQIIEGFENKGSYHKRFSLVMDVVNSFNGDYSYEEAFILGLPKSRQWAHEQFVEGEKEYFWTNKNIKGFGLYKLDGVVFPKVGMLTGLTASEIREWGYNLEMFDKEEVE